MTIKQIELNGKIYLALIRPDGQIEMLLNDQDAKDLEHLFQE